MADSRKSPKRTMTKRMWGGFISGKLDWHPTPDRPSLFTWKRGRAIAVMLYEDVRPVTVTYPAPIKRKARKP